MEGSILGVKISSKSQDELLILIKSRLKKREKTLFFTPNPEILVESARDPKFKEILNSSDINIADGVGLTLMSKLILGQNLTRIPGRVFFLKLLELANKESLKVFFLGASEEVNKLAVEKATREYPNAKFVGASAPLLDNEVSLISEKDTSIYNEIIKHINDYSPDILFVALGAPKQEKWIYKNKNLNVKVFLAIGGSLNYFVGKSVQPPVFISRGGLEWIWRGIFEPWRFKRIFRASIIFPYLVLKEKFLGKKNETKGI